MIKRFLIVAISLFSVILGNAAELEVGPYVWSVPTSSPYVPEFWTRIQDDADFNGTKKTLSYTSASSQTVAGVSCTALKVASQTLSNYKSGTYEYQSVNDYLVSVPMKGELSMYLKCYDTYTGFDETKGYFPSVKLYPAAKNEDGSYTVDTENEIATNMDDIYANLTSNRSNYYKLIAQLGAEYKYVACRFSWVNVALFTAESAIVPVKRVLTFNSIALSDGYTTQPFAASPDGKATIKCKFDITNNSNVTLDTDDENYYSMLAVMNGSTIGEQSVKGKLPTLAPGEKGVAELEFTVDITAYTPDAKAIVKVPISGITVLDETQTQKKVTYSDLQFKAYVAVMAMKYNSKDYTPGTETAPTYIDYGLFKNQQTQQVTFTNNGGAPLVITAVEAPKGVSFDQLTTLPLTIGAGASVTENVTLSGEDTIDGAINLTFDGNGTKTINVKGTGLKSTIAFYDFEDNKIPDSWYAYETKVETNTFKWVPTTQPSSSGVPAVNKRALYQNTTTPTLYPSSLVTGRLHFDADETLNFDIALKSTSYCELKLRISRDRQEWQEVAVFAKTAQENTLRFPTSTNKYTTYSVAMPEGSWYVDFYGANIYLDNVYGGKEAPQDIEILPIAASCGNMAMVNYPYEYSATYHNVGKNISDYKISLLAGEDVVAEADGEEFAAGADKTFTLSYYPHATGETAHKMVLTAKENVEIGAPVISSDIKEEVSELEVKVGNGTLAKEGVPLYLYDRHSKSEYIYTADKLGFHACTIKRIAYDFATTATNHGVTKTRIWLQNTSDEKISGTTYTPVEDMTLVYEYDGNKDLKSTGSTSTYLRMGFDFDNEFEYTGGNLRVVIESNATGYGRVYFASESSSTYALTSKASVNASDLATTTPTVNYFIPVTYFTTVLDVPEISGTVTTPIEIVEPEESAMLKETQLKGIEGVEVKAAAKDADVYYTAITDAEGKYTLPIMQASKDYTLTVSHPLYKDAEPQDVDFANPVHDFTMEYLYTSVEEINIEPSAEDVEVIYYDLQGRRVANPTSGIYVRIEGNKITKVIK